MSGGELKSDPLTHHPTRLNAVTQGLVQSDWPAWRSGETRRDKLLNREVRDVPTVDNGVITGVISADQEVAVSLVFCSFVSPYPLSGLVSSGKAAELGELPSKEGSSAEGTIAIEVISFSSERWCVSDDAPQGRWMTGAPEMEEVGDCLNDE